MRLPRLYAPGQPNLVEVRFVSLFDRVWETKEGPRLANATCDWFGRYVRQEKLQLHAWTLTPKRLCFVATPPNESNIAKVIQALGRCMAAHLRQGGVFMGRFHSALIEPAAWVLPAQIWVERRSVADGFVPEPTAWAWSSAGQHAGKPVASPGWAIALSDHEDYWGCGNTPFDRQAEYKRKLDAGLEDGETAQLEAALLGQWALGSPKYIDQLAKVANRRVQPGLRGRPRKHRDRLKGAPSLIN